MTTKSDALNKGRIPEGLPPLNTIYFYLTEGCNLACRHCWIRPGFDPAGDKYPTLPIDLFERAIMEAKPLGLSGVKLTGGEPLLHPAFMDLLEIIRRENLAVIIETNGLLCTPEVASSIAKSRSRFVSVSIDGADAQTHEWIRGVPGSFGRALKAVRNLVDASTPPQIIMTLMRNNAHQVEEMVHLAEDLGAASLKFNIMQPTARGENLFETGGALSVSELLEIQQFIENHLATDVKIKLIFDSPSAFHPISSIVNGKTPRLCGIRSVIGVLASGHYALCGIGATVPELVFGMVGRDSLEDVWRDNAILKEVRAELPERLSGTCTRCVMKNLCMGSCIAQNYYATGKIYSSFWFCEQAEKAGVFPKTRTMKTES